MADTADPHPGPVGPPAPPAGHPPAARARPGGVPRGGALRAFLTRYGAPGGAHPGLTLDALAARLQLPARELEAYLDGPTPGWLRAALAGLAVADFGEAPEALGWLLPSGAPGDGPEHSG